MDGDVSLFWNIIWQMPPFSHDENTNLKMDITENKENCNEYMIYS